MFRVELPSGRVFGIEADASILEAGERAGVGLNYSCRTGRCSTCKCKIVAGETVALHPETGLTTAERDAGFVLACVRAARSDLVLDVEDLGDVVLPARKTLPCRVQGLERLAPDVLGVRLRLPPTADFSFLPGQYVDVIGAGGVRRSYSLANADAANRQLELHVRAVDGGVMSEYWFGRAQPNDLLRLHGPLGTFNLRRQPDKHLVFLATGTGIAPVKSILEALPAAPDAAQPASITVFWGGRRPADLYFDPAALPGRHRFVPVLSRPPADWRGATGYVQDAALAAGLPLDRTAVYACGSDAMIAAAKACLIGAGLAENDFHSDAFVCSAASPTQTD